jgi:hypothetical protein
MDPFLEHPDFFPDLHDSLIIYAREYLQSCLPEPYYAASAERAHVELSRRSIGPDVSILRAEVPTPPEVIGAVNPEADNSGTAVATQPIQITVPAFPVRETYLEIYARQENERLVTSLEILSRSNKTSGEFLRDLYLRKQREIFNSQVNLVEIDLLRAGNHTTLIPQARLLEAAPAFQYHVCVWRFDQPEDFFIYPFTLADRLPVLTVPLLPGDPPVLLDLQAIFTRAYDTGPYRRRVNYRSVGVVPALNDAWDAWVQQRLEASGHRAG